VLQIAFGSGFKCNSAVWVANRNIAEKTYTWEVRRLNGTTDPVAGTSKTRTIYIHCTGLGRYIACAIRQHSVLNVDAHSAGPDMPWQQHASI